MWRLYVWRLYMRRLYVWRLYSLMKPSYKTNIPKFLLSRVLYNFSPFLPIWVIYLQEKHGMGLTQVTLIDSAFWLTMALTEVPTGAVADVLGRKQSYAIGIILSGGAALLFALAPTYPLLLFANSLWAFALTFVSGADLAFFFDTLRELGRVEEYARLRGVVTAIDVTATGVGGVIGGLLTLWSFESPFILYAILMVPALLIILTLKEPPRELDEESGLHLSFRQTLRVAAKALGQRPNLRYILGYSNLLPLVSAAIGITLIQPYAVEIGFPVASLGVIMLVLNGVRVLGAMRSSRLTTRLGESRHLALAPIPIVLGLVAMGAVPNAFGLVFFALTYFTSSATRPLIETVIHRQTPGSVRATILSVDSLLLRLLLALVSPLAGVLGDAFSLPVAFILLGIGVGVLLAILLWRWGARRELA
jgi:MFS family permease